MATASVQSNSITVQLGTKIVVAGRPGDQGVSVDTLTITNGHLIVGLSDGRSVDAGVLPVAPAIPGKDGENGSDGTDGVGIETIYVSSEDKLVIRLTDAREYTFDIMKGINGEAGPPGANGEDGVSITAVEVDMNGNLQVGFSNGDQINAGHVVGAPGPAGASVTGATINVSGHLILTLSTGTTIDCGSAVGPKGENGQGIPGTNGVSITGVAINEAGHLIVTLSDASTIDAGVIPGGTGGNSSIVGDTIVSAAVQTSDWHFADGSSLTASEYPELALTGLPQLPAGSIEQVYQQNAYEPGASWSAQINTLMIETEAEYLFFSGNTKNVNSITKDMQAFSTREIDIFGDINTPSAWGNYIRGYATNGTLHVFVSASGVCGYTTDFVTFGHSTVGTLSASNGATYYDEASDLFLHISPSTLYSSPDGQVWTEVGSFSQITSGFSGASPIKVVKFGGKYQIGFSAGYLQVTGFTAAEMTAGTAVAIGFGNTSEKIYATTDYLVAFDNTQVYLFDTDQQQVNGKYIGAMESTFVIEESNGYFDMNGNMYIGYAAPATYTNFWIGTIHDQTANLAAAQVHKKSDGLYFSTYGPNNASLSEFSAQAYTESSILLPTNNAYEQGMSRYIKVK